MSAHAAALVRVRNGDQGLACRATAGRHAHITGDVPRVAVFPSAALEHGYGTGEEQYRNRLTLRAACRGHRTARSYLSAAACRMAVHDRNTARHHRPASIARAKSLVGALDQEPLPLPRSAQPCTDRTAEASSRRQDRRARGAGNPSDHQWDSRGAAQQRLAPKQEQRTAPPHQTDIAAVEKCARRAKFPMTIKHLVLGAGTCVKDKSLVWH